MVVCTQYLLSIVRDEDADVDAEDGDDDTEESDGREHADELDTEEHPGGHDDQQDGAVQAVVVEVDGRRPGVEHRKHWCYVVLDGKHNVVSIMVMCFKYFYVN